MTFTTRSGSLYEVQHYHGTSKGRIRRRTGSAEPTPRQGIDGRWREYEDISDVRVHRPVVIVWTPDGVQGTITSTVVEVQP